MLAPADPAMLIDRVRGALWGIFIADSLSMPVHWYYSTSDISRDFGKITGYEAPKQRHPSSIMSLRRAPLHLAVINTVYAPRWIPPLLLPPFL